MWPSILACLRESLQGQSSVIVDNVVSTNLQTHLHILQEPKLGTLLHLPNLAQQWLVKLGCVYAKLAWWALAHCWLSKFVCKLTNNIEVFMDSSTNLLHVEVARMLAFILWVSIGRKIGRLPNFWHVLKQCFRLTRTYQSRHKMRGGSGKFEIQEMLARLAWVFAHWW